jgi:hypothetical protein
MRWECGRCWRKNKYQSEDGLRVWLPGRLKGMRVPFLILVVFLAGQVTGRAKDRLPLGRVKESAAAIDAALIRQMIQQRAVGWVGVEVPPRAADADFLRRLMVDFAGRLPTPAEVREFLNDPRDAKWESWIEKVASLPKVGEWRFRRVADVLRVRDEVKGISLRPYIDWLRERVAEDMPYDDLVKRLLLAQGSLQEDPATGFLLTDGGEARLSAVETVRALLGKDIRCAMCHDDPFADTTQRSFSAFAGAFNRVVEDENANGNGNGNGKVLRLGEEPTPFRLPANYPYRDGRPGEVVPLAPLVSFPELAVGGSEWSEGARLGLAEWITGEKNGRFQEVAVLRVWQWMFGQPVRHHRVSDRLFELEAPEEMLSRLNDCVAIGPGPGSPVGWDWLMQAPHLEFLAVLRQEWHRCGRRMGEFQRILAHTQAYQRKAVATEDRQALVGSFLPSPMVRRLPAEVIYGALLRWAGSEDKQISREVVPGAHPLRLLGRGGRVWADSDRAEVTHEVVRFLMNGALVEAAVDLIQVDGDRAVEEGFLRILGRWPSVQEQRLAQVHVETEGRGGIKNVLWALLNTSEFLFER